MNFDVFLAVVGFSFAAAMTPGPNNMMVMASGANFGFRRTLPHMAGITIGFPVMLVLVGIGLIRLFDMFPASYTILKAGSVAYLLVLAWKIATAAAPDEADPSGRPISFLQAAMFQWVNPKGWAACLTAITVYVGAGNVAGVLLLAAVFFVCGMISTSTWTMLGQQLRRLLSSNARLRAFNWTMAALLVATLYPVLTI